MDTSKDQEIDVVLEGNSEAEHVVTPEQPLSFHLRNQEEATGGRTCNYTKGQNGSPNDTQPKMGLEHAPSSVEVLSPGPTATRTSANILQSGSHSRVLNIPDGWSLTLHDHLSSNASAGVDDANRIAAAKANAQNGHKRKHSILAAAANIDIARLAFIESPRAGSTHTRPPSLGARPNRRDQESDKPTN